MENNESKRSYTAPDTVFAWASLIFGYLFMRALPAYKNNLGAFLLILTAYISTFIFFKAKRIKMPVLSIVVGASAIIMSASLIISGNDFLIFLSFSYSLVCYCYFIYSALGNSVKKGVSDFIAVDFFKAVFVMPFYSIAELFSAIANKRSKNVFRYVLKILCGLFLAVIPTLVILTLLSYDSGFIDLLDKIFSFDTSEIVSHLISIIFAIPAAMYIFGLYSSSMHKVMENTITAKECKNAMAEIRIMPKLTALSATLPILFLYVVYFISQWKYYVSGFTGILPENFSYAEYAREGFFQLCAVSVINLIIILVIVTFMRRKAGRPDVILRVIAVTFCASTLVLITTAVSKLVMYISSYGLTEKRIYAMWLMIVIAIVYIIIAIGQFTRRIKPIFTSAAVCVVLFSALALCNADAVIAEYNVDRYINGTLDTVDIYALDSMGESAVPSLVRLSEHLEEKKSSGAHYSEALYEELHEYLDIESEYLNRKEMTVFSFNIPEYRAKKAIKALK